MTSVFYTQKSAFMNQMVLFIYASNEPKSVLARDLGDCCDNLRNSRSMFLIVLQKNEGGRQSEQSKKSEIRIHVIRKLTIMKNSFAGWWKNRRICACQRNWFRIAQNVVVRWPWICGVTIPLYRMRAGIVQRTNMKISGKSWKNCRLVRKSGCKQ